MNARVVSFEDALAEVMRHATSAPSLRTIETVNLLEAQGRVLAKAICADRDQPPFDRATRDGFAVRASDLVSGLNLQIIGQVRAGDRWTGPAMRTGEAIEIMTGAPLPSGADAVVMIEHVEISTDTLRLSAGRTLKSDENLVPTGSEARRSEVVAAPGTVIAAAEIALAATSGLSELSVQARPRVAIVATGDELVEVNETPDERQIRNSNSYAIAAMVTSAGGEAVRLEIARDTREQIRERIAVGRSSNLLLFSGGVSMGKFDLVEEVLAEFGAEFFFTGVKMQPGKPLVFGRLPATADAAECFFFGLPGNPISTQVTFHCFVEPFLRTLCGEPDATPRFVQATLAEAVAGKRDLMRVLPARLTPSLKTPSVHLIGWHGSGDLAANGRANCYAVLPPDRDHFLNGDVITVLLR